MSNNGRALGCGLFCREERALIFEQKVAASHFSTLFLKADVANVPWLVHKLDLKILPCVMSFGDGNAKDR